MVKKQYKKENRKKYRPLIAEYSFPKREDTINLFDSLKRNYKDRLIDEMIYIRGSNGNGIKLSRPYMIFKYGDAVIEIERKQNKPIKITADNLETIAQVSLYTQKILNLKEDLILE
ncbi:MAG: hypothetical protein AABW81_02845 [Nanoarchaeota archaeon]